MTQQKPKIAFFDFASCEGCQLTVIDSLQTNLELLNAVEIVNFREAMSEKGQDYQIAFIEGSCSRKSDEARLQAIREQADIVVALGACAHLGGVNAVRNRQPLEDVRTYVYGNKADWYETYPARPISQVITVDATIPGCPIDRDEFIASVKMLLQGRIPKLPETPLCVECKLLENQCVYTMGKVCLGPIVRAGCKAICPSFGDGCEGCRGLVSEPNMESLKQVMAEHGMADQDISHKLDLFLTYQMMNLENEEPK
nr:NADH:ubiquinone oxidoreductase [Anaerolineae bacterium]